MLQTSPFESIKLELEIVHAFSVRCGEQVENLSHLLGLTTPLTSLRILIHFTLHFYSQHRFTTTKKGTSPVILAQNGVKT